MSTSRQLFELLKDPIRSRIMFEFMLNRHVTINQLAQIMDKDRTTINYHLKKFEEAGVIKEVDQISHTRGKPTTVYGLSNQQYKIEKEEDKSSLKSDLLDQAKNLNMLAAVLEQSQQAVSSQDINDNSMQVEYHMLMLSENDASKLYQGLHQYVHNFMQERPSSSRADTDSHTYIFYTGTFPVVRDISGSRQ